MAAKKIAPEGAPTGRELAINRSRGILHYAPDYFLPWNSITKGYPPGDSIAIIISASFVIDFFCYKIQYLKFFGRTDH